MKRFVCFLLALVMLLSLSCVTAFGANKALDAGATLSFSGVDAKELAGEITDAYLLRVDDWFGTRECLANAKRSATLGGSDTNNTLKYMEGSGSTVLVGASFQEFITDYYVTNYYGGEYICVFTDKEKTFYITVSNPKGPGGTTPPTSFSFGTREIKDSDNFYAVKSYFNEETLSTTLSAEVKGKTVKYQIHIPKDESFTFTAGEASVVTLEPVYVDGREEIPENKRVTCTFVGTDLIKNNDPTTKMAVTYGLTGVDSNTSIRFNPNYTSYESVKARAFVCADTEEKGAVITATVAADVFGAAAPGKYTAHVNFVFALADVPTT